MSGLFNLLHKPQPSAQDEVDVEQIKNDQKKEIEPKKLQDKSADEFEEDEDQEVDGLFEDEISPGGNDNSGITSNIAMANINQEIEEIEPQQNTALESIGLDVSNFQTLMNNPSLTQHLISMLTANLQKQEQKTTNQATPVFSYAEIMKTQLQGDRSSKIVQLLKQHNKPSAERDDNMMLPQSSF